MSKVSIESRTLSLKDLLNDTYTMDYYQRGYVWKKEQLEELIDDLSNGFLKQYRDGQTNNDVISYNPYYMGEIILSKTENNQTKVIDGQQRMSTFTLILIYMLNVGKNSDLKLPNDLCSMIYRDHYGKEDFNLQIEDRIECMNSLRENGSYTLKDSDNDSVHNLLERYNDIESCWNMHIKNDKLVMFAYWIMEKVIFTVVETDDDEYAYIIFETMNDRGMNLTQTDMLRSHLLSKVNESQREKAIKSIDDSLAILRSIKLPTGAKPEFEFFKSLFRGRYAETLSKKSADSDFVLIGKAFHKWVFNNENKLELGDSQSYMNFIESIGFYAKVYQHIFELIEKQEYRNHLYLYINEEYGFTMQAAPILAAISLNDKNETIDTKINIITKYLCRTLSWRVWNHITTAQSYMEMPVYEMCKLIRDKSPDELLTILESDPMESGKLINTPTLNQQNNHKIRVLISLIDEIVRRESEFSSQSVLSYSKPEIEHIWADHYEMFNDECLETEFSDLRNKIGDLLVLEKQFNASYGDLGYKEKSPFYYGKNQLASSLCKKHYERNPGFLRFKERSGLKFEPKEMFGRNEIKERSELYKNILLWNWGELE